MSLQFVLTFRTNTPFTFQPMNDAAHEWRRSNGEQLASVLQEVRLTTPSIDDVEPALRSALSAAFPEPTFEIEVRLA